MHRRVARLVEAFELGADPALRDVEHRDDAVLRVADDGEPVVDRLDAPRPRAGADAADDLLRAEVEHDDVALEVGGDVGDRSAAEPGRERPGLGGERDRA